MKRRDAQSIGDIIADMIRTTGQTDNYRRQRACYLWAEIVGQAINRYTTRRYVTDDGTMHVHISSAPLKAELEQHKPTLLRKINDAAGEGTVTKLHIH